MESDQSYFNYWGKARPLSGEQPSWHLLPYHCLDVAACGFSYLKKTPYILQLLQQTLKLPEQDVLNWVAFWLAMHDLGKFASSFQGQRADIVQALQGRTVNLPYRVRHDSLGMLLWQESVSDSVEQATWFGPDTANLMLGLNYWVKAVMGHHGQPPAESGESIRPYCQYPLDVQVATAFCVQMKTMFLAKMDFSIGCFVDARYFLHSSRWLSWWIAGIAVLADWIGSNQAHFPYIERHMPLEEYWSEALAKSELALNEAGVLPVEVKAPLAFTQLFPEISVPSPLQAWASEVDLNTGPQIHFLEDVTGAGKTEAAMILVHRLMSIGAADGFYIGLPTMATANAMYGRLSEFYRRLFDGLASMSLANAQRDLMAAFADSVLRPGQEEADAAQQDETATARCTAWLADHNKRALLAPAGVGTIDQALMAALQGKHQSLRLLGLFRKVLVIDEVHACDSYMQGVLECLLECHARVGGSAILLSATLPQAMKQSLLNAFTYGAEGQEFKAPPLRLTGYPLVTNWSASQTNRIYEQMVDTRHDVRRLVRVRYLADIQAVVAGIKEALAVEQCVCWIRNTVSDALEAYALFAMHLAADKLSVFHARFVLHDRLNIEQFILQHFGKNSTPDLRRGRLVIATQVVEQSLDADWDLVVSDLAPIDRLIQRAGRLQRHRRDAQGARLLDPTQTDGRNPPMLWVLGPPWQDEPAANWFKAAFPKSAKVYRHSGQLWLTAQRLQREEFSMPEDARSLIEYVFGSDTDLPVGLQAEADGVVGVEMCEASLAQQNTIKLWSGYQRAAGIDWWADAKTPSRLGEPSINVLLARWCDGRLQPWVRHENIRHAWAYSTVRVPQRLIEATSDMDDSMEQAELLRIQEELPDKGRWSVLLPLRETSQGWTGEAIVQEGKQPIKQRWIYDTRFGLRVMP